MIRCRFGLHKWSEWRTGGKTKLVGVRACWRCLAAQSWERPL